MEITGHFECLNPWGWSTPPNIQQEEERNKEERNLRAFVFLHLSGPLQVDPFAGEKHMFQIPLSFARGVSSVYHAHLNIRV